jgi:hypothetical protein
VSPVAAPCEVLSVEQPVDIERAPSADAASAMVGFWIEAADTAQKFWSGPTSPTAIAQALAEHASEMMAEAAAPPKPKSWYRPPIDVQDSASGAIGFMAGPFAGLVPIVAAAFTPSTMSLANPWMQLWAEAATSAMWASVVPKPFAMLAPLGAAAVSVPSLPFYQSDSGFAVAQIIRATGLDPERHLH